MKYLEVFDTSLTRIDVLSTAKNVTETEPLNGVPTLSFTVPANDSRAECLQKRRFVRWDHGEVYRILNTEDVNADTKERTITCEGAIATLADDVMFQDHIIDSSQNTTQAINYILGRQTTARWRLGTCDFNFRYEYAFSSENLLNALFSLATPFTQNYRFVTDTSVYPWRISLKSIASTPTFYVFERLNFLQEKKTEESSQLYTRLYGLGAGEGVNQVTISGINGGKPYVDAPSSVIAKYGIISGVFAAREYDNAQTLKQAMDSMILQCCEPQTTYAIDAVDLHELGTGSLLDANAGDTIRLSDGTITYITQTVRKHDTPGDLSLTISNKAKDLANSLAELADRQRIEMTYSQGATQLWSNTTSDNASSSNGHEHPIWMPASTKIVNSVNIKIELERFRAYSRTTSSTADETRTSSSESEKVQTSSSTSERTETSSSTSDRTETSSSGGASTATSSASGSISTSTASSGEVNETSSSGGGVSSSSTGDGVFNNASVSTSAPSPNETGKTAYNWDSVDNHRHSLNDHKHTVPPPQHKHKFSIDAHRHKFSLPSHSHSVNISAHQHTVSIPDHTHTVTVKGHTHTVRIPGHTHTVRIPGHSHTLKIPGHRHEVEYGIYTYNEAPASAQVYINNTFAFTMGTSWEGDITNFLIGSNGKIPRGTFIKVKVVPNTLAKVTVSSATQAFIQSKTGGVY